MFTWFVTLQFNDVDAWVWIIAYGLAALLSLLNMSSKLHRVVGTMSAVLGYPYAFWAIALYQQTSGRWWDGEVEREVGGLAITALAMLILNIFSRRASRFS
ncbi:MAG: transmembrane 220 family protein [Candidatus Kapaibacterium sp.]